MRHPYTEGNRGFRADDYRCARLEKENFAFVRGKIGAENVMEKKYGVFYIKYYRKGKRVEKIQTEVVSMLRAGVKAAGSYRTSNVDAAFNKLLKEQNRGTDDQAKETAASGKDSSAKAPDTGKEETKPVKESGQKEEAEVGTKKGEVVPSELLLQLQESAGQLVTGLTGELISTAEQAVEVVETLSAAQPELLAAANSESVGEFPLQTETSELQDAAEGRTVQLAGMQVEQEAGAEKAAPEWEKGEPVKAEQKQPEALAPREAMADQKTAKPEISAKAAGSETKGNTEEQQQVVGMTEQPSREHFVREPEHVASEPVRTSEPTLVNDVGRAIAQRLPASDGTLAIELEPASLGKMTIRVLYESGKATVSILATNPRTLELLSARAGELASILEERTGQETVIYTEQPESEQPFDERQGEGRERDREPESREHKEQKEQDSFLQQLRLGVI